MLFRVNEHTTNFWNLDRNCLLSLIPILSITDSLRSTDELSSLLLHSFSCFQSMRTFGD